MKIDIITPEQQLSMDEVTLVQLPGMDGLFEILKDHAPMISALGVGKAKIEVAGQTKFYNIKHGVVEVLKNHIKVMTESCSE